MDGNGEKLRQTLAQLSGVGRILADGSGDIVDTIENLQTFVTVLRDSNEQIVQFQDRFATLVQRARRQPLRSRRRPDQSVQAVGDVSGSSRAAATRRSRTGPATRERHPEPGRPPDGSRARSATSRRPRCQRVQHVRPENRRAGGVFVLNNFANPTLFICGMIGAIENVTAPETGKLCAQYLGPGLHD